MLLPKKVKYRKWHVMRKNPKKIGLETRGTTLSFGSFGIKATSAYRITSQQIESARKVLAREIGKNGKIWIRIFPDMPYTKKPAEVKLGKGKGDLEGYCSPVKAGRVLFEVDGVSEAVAREAFRKAGTKLPVRSVVISRELVA
ncbi:MAG: 50S ribosomal protein L16 [Candidatus Paceibacterota bacterium]|jgi:large subunit ribosomal protein L16